MGKDSGIPLQSLQVDGGMTANQLLMQLQTDLLGISVVRPSMPETTALGAAMAAGAAEGVGVWSLDSKDLSNITTDTFNPCIREKERDARFIRWKLAVQRSMHWETAEDVVEIQPCPLSTVPGGIFIISSLAMFMLSEIIPHR
eukprot:XP_011436347.1 PREDICTED: glycerol kinase isoform X1 [Crassostrea gigas]